MAQPHISLAAEKIGSLFGVPITNSLLMTWFVMLILICLAYLSTRKISLIPSNLQLIAEIVVDGLYGLFKSVVGEQKVQTFFPLLATLFLFIAVANWGGLLPGVGTIGTYVSAIHEQTVAELTPESINATTKTAELEFVPYLRGATADLNTTLAIAITAVVAIQYYGIKSLGLAYFKKFINLSNPIMFGVGLLEIISEFSRIISFAFRLFGNIFAGEVLLTIVAFLVPVLASFPFIGLEIFVGFIQALVFSMLTAVFINGAIAEHH